MKRIEGKKVVMDQKTTSTKGWVVKSTLTLDFTNCSDEQILALAAEQALIRYRQKTAVKTLDETAAKGILSGVVDVAQVFGQQEKKISPLKTVEARAKELVKGGMSPLEALRLALDEAEAYHAVTSK